MSIIISTFCLVTFVTPAYAQIGINDEDQDATNNERWDITLGIDGEYQPKTEGSNVYEFNPKAYFDITYQNRWFLSSDNGFGLYLFRKDETELGLSLGRGDDRQEDDDPLLLEGLPIIKKGFSTTIFASYEIDDILEISVDLIYDFGDAEGLLIDISADHEFELLDKIQFEIGASTLWAEGRVLNALYGVTPRQALSRATTRITFPYFSPLIPIDITSSFHELSMDTSLTYSIAKAWSTGLDINYTRFLGQVNDSVLTRETSEIDGAIFIRYEF